MSSFGNCFYGIQEYLPLLAVEAADLVGHNRDVNCISYKILIINVFLINFYFEVCQSISFHSLVIIKCISSLSKRHSITTNNLDHVIDAIQ